MKKCRFKKFLIFNFAVFGLLSTCSGVYAQENVTSQFKSESQQSTEDDEVAKAKVNNFQQYIINNCGDFDFSDPDPRHCKRKPLEVEKYKQEADRLLKAVDDFVKKSDEAKVAAENFDDYVKTFVESGVSMKCLPRVDFEQQFSPAVNANGSVKRFYKEFENIEDVKKFRSGVPVVRGSVRGNLFGGFFYKGFCIDIRPKKMLDMSQAYKSERKKDDKTGLQWHVISSAGEVVEMAVDTDKLKCISSNHLDKVIATLLYYNYKIGNACDYFDQGYSWYKIKNFQEEEYHNKLKVDLFKQVFNFEFSELAEKLKPDFRNLEKDEQERFRGNLDFFVNSGLKKIPAWVDAQNRLLSESEVKPHFVDKRCAVLANMGLVAKLLGYDAFVNEGEDKKIDFEKCNLSIVNPGVLTVCTENNTDYAVLMTPTIENLKKVFEDTTLYYIV